MHPIFKKYKVITVKNKIEGGVYTLWKDPFRLQCAFSWEIYYFLNKYIFSPMFKVEIRTKNRKVLLKIFCIREETYIYITKSKIVL